MMPMSRQCLVSCVLVLLCAALGVAQDSAPAGGSDMPPATSASFRTLAGDLPELVSAADGPYIVTANIVVPPGKTVTLEPGTFLLFRNFTGIQVHGTLIAVGTKEQPIAFTSEHDQRHGSLSRTAPAPYDWDGITVTENSVGTTFEFCRIGYSLYGINALTDYFTIRNCVFRKNGKSHLTIKGTKQEVAGGVPFSYEPLGEAPDLGTERISPVRITLRTSSIALFVVGGAVAVWQGIEYSQARDHFDALNDDTNVSNLRNPTIIEDWDEAKDMKDANLLGTILGASGAGLGAIGFTVTLF